MNIKFLFVALSLFSIFFLYPDKTNAQTSDPLVCCQFNATDASNHERSYCSMVSKCEFNSVNGVKVDNTNIIEGSISQQLGQCYDDYNIKQESGKLGTNCQDRASQNTNTTYDSACDNGSLSDCIASKMPNKNGSVGSNKSTDALVDAVSTIINTILGLLGLIFTGILIYAGIQWIHYGGESDGKKKASKRIKNAIIGLAITLSAYSLTTFIINNLK